MGPPLLPTQNLVLAALSHAEREMLLRGARRVALRAGRVVYEQDTLLGGVYFPLSGAISMLTVMEDGDTLEAAVVGRESVLGFPLALGVELSPWRSVVQLSGEALVVEREALRAQLAQPGLLSPLLTHHAGLLLQFTAQSGACNHFHSIGQRCARWLLLMHDRAESDSFLVTQQFLSEMIGARRPSVSIALQTLRDAGAIRYSRGTMTVVDRVALERAVCECYARVRRRYDTLSPSLEASGSSIAG